MNSCTVQYSKTAGYTKEYTELFSLAQGKYIGEKFQLGDCQPTSWIKYELLASQMTRREKKSYHHHHCQLQQSHNNNNNNKRRLTGMKRCLQNIINPTWKLVDDCTLQETGTNWPKKGNRNVMIRRHVMQSKNEKLVFFMSSYGSTTQNLMTSKSEKSSGSHLKIKTKLSTKCFIIPYK